VFPISTIKQETYMPNTLTVEIYPDADAISDDMSDVGAPTVFKEIDFVSFVNEGTFGPPALVAPSPKDGRAPLARPGQKVLYINTSLVPLFAIERDGDED
jgi:hypothetical protein